jgi:hypothetical protein
MPNVGSRSVGRLCRLRTRRRDEHDCHCTNFEAANERSACGTMRWREKRLRAGSGFVHADSILIRLCLSAQTRNCSHNPAFAIVAVSINNEDVAPLVIAGDSEPKLQWKCIRLAGWHGAGISEQSLNYLARNQNIFIEQVHRAHSMITVSDNDSAITLVSDEENGRKLFSCR